jgi:hypothetical protein
VAKETVTASWSPAHLNFPDKFSGFSLAASLHFQKLITQLFARPSGGNVIRSG